MNDEEFLNLISKNAEMGKIGIDCVYDYAKDERMKKALLEQAKEYDKIYSGAVEMLKAKNCKVEHVGAMAKMGSEMNSAMKTMTDRSSSKIAEMMIQGSTMGVTKLMRNQSNYDGADDDILKLSQKLQKTEENNISQMKNFL